MIGGATAELTFDVVSPAVAIPRCRCGARMSARCLHDCRWRQSYHPHGGSPVDRGSVAKLAERVSAPAIVLSSVRARAGMNSASRHGCEIAFGLDVRWLRAV